MKKLVLIGIGTGNPDHLTLQAVKALKSADLVMIPRKGETKADLAEVRRAICTDVIGEASVPIAEFDLPVRDEQTADYRQRVEDWHDAIAKVWQQTMAAYPWAERVALLVWGDPSLYDSTLRIAARVGLPVQVVPGITAIQALTAAHAIPLNEIGAPVVITTGRQLRESGWPGGSDRIVVMLDGSCAFQSIDPEGISIWWGAYLGMAEEIIFSGNLAQVGPRIVAAREAARAAHGWIMDIYILSRVA